MAERRDTAKVVEYDRVGGADVLQVRPRPLAPPGPGEVTVEVITAGINHIDSFIRAGIEPGWADDPWPRLSGSDFAGIVVAVGSGVRRFRRGSEVIGHVREGAQATFLNVAESAPREQTQGSCVGGGRRPLSGGGDGARDTRRTADRRRRCARRVRRRRWRRQHRGAARSPARRNGDRHLRRPELRLSSPARDQDPFATGRASPNESGPRRAPPSPR